MLYTITVVSPEVEDFVIELQIESDATFADLHQLIRRSCAWGPHKPSTFYVCDDHWHRDRTIPEQSYEYDTMDEVELGDYLDDEGQRLQYIFDAEEGRGLLMEVSHINYGSHIDEPVCRRSHGTPPALVLEKLPSNEKKSTQDLLAELNAAALAEEDDMEPTDDDLFDLGEIDLEGFDFTEGE
ncbi:MAG: plasmid pRiA4b ORF-3 family protein [Bacteroidales bacterium]|nr:plasmid pRiA4b ORF-3 family protein [Bacteroidales bacterium]